MTDENRKKVKELAAEIADITSAIINLNRHKVDHKYAAQFLLEEVVADLEERI